MLARNAFSGKQPAMSATLSHFASFDGTQLAVHREGAGRPVILLHGLFSSAHMNWIKWGHAARLAEAGFEAVMLDFRVHGQSAAPHDPASYPAGVLVRDVAALVQHLGLEEGEYDLVGFSLGARTALHACANGVLAPRRLVACGMGLSGISDWQRRAAFFKRVIDEFDTITRDDPAYLSRQFLKSQGVDRKAARLLLGAFDNLDPALIAKIATPALVLCGIRDTDNGSAEELAALIPGAPYQTVPGGHLDSATKPELGEGIVDFLKA
jgi:pimeloyl-ACP methyl ester carboxylesterase